jgi:LacI family transcriptional regulator
VGGNSSLSTTVKEIAIKANVSPATVSMILNNKPGISPETRERVLRIIEESGYSVSPLKKQTPKCKGRLLLAIYKKHSKVLGDTPFFQALIEGIEHKARHNSYQLTINYMSGSVDMDSLAANLQENVIDGVLLLGTEMEAQDFRNFLQLDIPLLLLDSYFMNISADYVVIDNASGVYRGTEHLLEAGHREIGYLKSSVPIQNFQERYEGYGKALAEHGLAPVPDFTVELQPSMDGSYEDMLRFLSRKPRLPSAFVADNDIIALGAIRALKENNIRIPEEISIIGFDDMPYCTLIEPRLSTIRVDKNILGQLAVENLIARIERKSGYHCRTALGVTLVQRESVKTLK